MGSDAGISAIGPNDPRVIAYFGERLGVMSAFADMLSRDGVERGLIGPREVPRLWERHLLNSASVVPFLSDGTVIDVGSGAGLPGIVIAVMQPERTVTLVEPMERRVAWLKEVVEALGLTNVSVVRARAEDLAGTITARVVTARAVASIHKLVPWCAPLLAEGGEMLFLKGRSVETEIAEAKRSLAKSGFEVEILEARTLDGCEPTRVVRLYR